MNSSPFATRISLGLALLAGSLVVNSASLLAQTPQIQTFDQNGTNPNYGLDQTVVYDWTTATGTAVWNTNQGGGAGTLSAWDNSRGDVARFSLIAAEYHPPVPGNYQMLKVRLADDIAVGGITIPSPGSWGSVYLQADAPASGDPYRSINIASGGKLTTDAPAVGLGLYFGNNVAVNGDLTLNGGNNGTVQITGSGPAYSGTITIATGNSINSGFSVNFALADASRRSRSVADTRFVINSGALIVNTLGAAEAVEFRELSGSGGFLRPSGQSLVSLNQDTDTVWAGQIGGSTGSSFIAFTKKGTGRLSLTGTGVHNAGPEMRVDSGALYIRSSVLYTVGTRSDLAVSDGATLGGTLTTDKRLKLDGAESLIDPGMYGKAGTMTLTYGLEATQGGTFQFHLGGVDEDNDAIHSQIVLTGGTLTISGMKTVNLLDLGDSPILAGVAYVLLDASSSGVTHTARWEDNWTIGLNQTGLDIASFGVVADQLQVTFEPIPEPSTVALFGIAAAGLIYRRRSRKLNA